MYLKGSTKPVTGYTSIDVAGDELVPMIEWDESYERTDKFTVHFSAQSSTGANIDWSRCVWTFGDFSSRAATQTGPRKQKQYTGT